MSLLDDINTIARGCGIDLIDHAMRPVSSTEPQQPRNRFSFAPVEGSSPTAGIGTADAGIPYPVTCRARYYDAASRILQEEGQLFTHDNCNELGALIEQWINDARDNWEPR